MGEKMTKGDLLDMKLHEHRNIDNWRSVQRVIDGWIYLYSCPKEEGNDFGVFVPELPTAVDIG